MAEPLLEVRNLKKYFPVRKGLFKRTVGHVKAVDDISFHIGRSETFGLVGESGCGKTTVGKLVMRLHEADEGAVLLDGEDIHACDKKRLRRQRRHFQIVFQDPYGSLDPTKTVESILSEPVKKHCLMPGEEIPGHVRQMLEMVGMSGQDMRKYPHEFSGGQRQRIVVARALTLKPKLIVCDEPVSALDVSVQAQILNLLKDFQKEWGVSYLFIAHGMAAVKHISQRTGVMYLGKLVETAESGRLFESCAHPYTQALMSSIPLPKPDVEKRRIVLEGEVPDPIDPPSGCRFHTRCFRKQSRCTTEEPSLRDIGGGHLVACHYPLCTEETFNA